MASVYQIKNLADGKQYIGFTAQPPAVRWRGHLRAALAGAETAIARAIHKHGREAFEFRVLASDMEAALALWLESEMIRSLGTMVPAGYNLTSGGERPAPGPETREKLAASRRGKVYPKEVRAKIAAAARNISPETRRRRSESSKGKVRSAAVKAQMALAASNPSAETRAKMSAAKKGRPLPESHRNKIAEALGGRPELRQEVVHAVLVGGLSQRQAARSYGVSRSAVKRWVAEAAGPGSTRPPYLKANESQEIFASNIPALPSKEIQ